VRRRWPSRSVPTNATLGAACPGADGDCLAEGGGEVVADAARLGGVTDDIRNVAKSCDGMRTLRPGRYRCSGQRRRSPPSRIRSARQGGRCGTRRGRWPSRLWRSRLRDSTMSRLSGKGRLRDVDGELRGATACLAASDDRVIVCDNAGGTTRAVRSASEIVSSARRTVSSAPRKPSSVSYPISIVNGAHSALKWSGRRIGSSPAAHFLIRCRSRIAYTARRRCKHSLHPPQTNDGRVTRLCKHSLIRDGLGVKAAEEPPNAACP
jgi:hypothetical protein